MSQPKPRRTCDVGGCCGVVIFSIINGDKIVLPFSKACANFARSSAVENNTRVPSHAAHPARRGIVNDSAQHLVVLVILRGRNLRQPGRRRQKTRVHHLQRSKNILLAVLVQRHS